MSRTICVVLYVILFVLTCSADEQLHVSEPQKPTQPPVFDPAEYADMKAAASQKLSIGVPCGIIAVGCFVLADLAATQAARYDTQIDAAERIYNTDLANSLRYNRGPWSKAKMWSYWIGGISAVVSAVEITTSFDAAHAAERYKASRMQIKPLAILGACSGVGIQFDF